MFAFFYIVFFSSKVACSSSLISRTQMIQTNNLYFVHDFFISTPALRVELGNRQLRMMHWVIMFCFASYNFSYPEPWQHCGTSTRFVTQNLTKRKQQPNTVFSLSPRDAFGFDVSYQHCAFPGRAVSPACRSACMIMFVHPPFPGALSK